MMNKKRSSYSISTFCIKSKDTSKHSRITFLLDFLPLIVVGKLTTLCACLLPRLDFQPFETRSRIDTDLQSSSRKRAGTWTHKTASWGLRSSLQEHPVFSALVSPAEKNRHYFPEGEKR